GHSYWNLIDEFNTTGIRAWRHYSWVSIAKNRPLSDITYFGCDHGWHLSCLLISLESLFLINAT
ncbi:unnamed protein product, partial [Allacma fusca]